MKVIVTGGGTAGHVNPALSIAKTIEKLDDSAEIEFIGTQSGIESRLVPKAGYNISYIKVYGLIRSLSPKNVKVAYMAMKSYLDCRKLLKEKAPDVVVGTGGYVTWPVCRAAASLGIPTVLHEANAVPGFAVKMLRKKANVIFGNFEGTKKMLYIISPTH
jgi:UDP-N-acetylglucosamine--N-acetylmuramyl-(pentapeptide) pyrophosphoryl-undecaprenol N-acetylglucosamine transferase